MNEVLRELQRELYRLAEQLGSDVRPGHVDYISKKRASQWCASLTNRIGELVAVMERKGKTGGSEANDQA